MTYIVFDTLKEYNDYTSNGTRLSSGVLYLVKENNGLFFLSNNFDGTLKVYEYFGGTPQAGYVELVNPYTSKYFGMVKAAKSVDIPDGVTTIDDNAFQGGMNLTSVTMPNSVTRIGDGAFSGCRSLTSVTMSDSVTYIGESAFNDCSSLTSINIPDGVTSIGENTFYNCKKLTSVTFGNGIKTIGKSAFYACYGLTSINIPDGVTRIGSYAFNLCEGLTSLTIGTGVTSIGESAFMYCAHLESITIKATTPPTLGSSALGISNCPIYVPAESVELYREATNWSAYADRIQAIS